MGLSDAEIRALRDGCTEFVAGHGPTRVPELLATIPPETEVDRYGDGGVVGELERDVAERLGKPAAVFLPSGTMSQQAVLRVHADRIGQRTVLWHPMCHLDQHEGRGHERLHGLVGRPVGEAHRLLTLDDLSAVAEPFAALLVELPQRDIGGQQPSWEDLCTQVAWARGRAAAVHLDGARLWESAAGYGRSPADIAALFDTVYVSFYKGIGALPGCCVAGSEEVVAQVREWRRRMGGTLFGLWPMAASALTCLRKRADQMPDYFRHAVAIAEALRGAPGVRVLPDPPQTPMMHVLLETTEEAFTAQVRRLAEEQKVWTWGAAAAAGVPGVVKVELSVGDATCALAPERVAEVLGALAADG